MFESTASSSIFVFVRLIAERPFTLLSFPPSLSASSSPSPFDVHEDEQSNRDARDRRLEFERHHDDDDDKAGAIDIIILAETEVRAKTCTNCCSILW